MKTKLLRGVVPPLVTPLLSRDTLDVEGLESLIEHVLSGGVSGLFLLGTTGEGPSLSHELRRQVIEIACRQVGSRVPIVVAVTDTALPELLDLAHFATDCGAAGVVLAPPYYFGLAQAELIEFVDAVLVELPIPLVLYNMPALTKTHFDLGTVRQLIERENIIGIKDSSGDMAYFHQLLRIAPPDWSVMMGSETLMAEAILFGADGGVCGGANVAPALFVELFTAASSHDWERVRSLQDKVLDLGERLYSVGNHGSSAIKGIKGALSCLGIGNGGMCEPFRAFDEIRLGQLQAALISLNLTQSAPSGVAPGSVWHSHSSTATNGLTS